MVILKVDQLVEQKVEQKVDNLVVWKVLRLADLKVIELEWM
jgi:hypothetical protein